MARFSRLILVARRSRWVSLVKYTVDEARVFGADRAKSMAQKSQPSIVRHGHLEPRDATNGRLRLAVQRQSGPGGLAPHPRCDGIPSSQRSRRPGFGLCGPASRAMVNLGTDRPPIQNIHGLHEPPPPSSSPSLPDLMVDKTPVTAAMAS